MVRLTDCTAWPLFSGQECLNYSCCCGTDGSGQGRLLWACGYSDAPTKNSRLHSEVNLQKLIQEFTVLFYFNVFFLLQTWPGFTKKPRNLKAIWTSKIRCMNRALMVGVLTPPQSLILYVICNGGWRFVKIGSYVYF